MNGSIRRRLTVSLLSTLFVVFAAGMVALHFAVREEFIESFDQALATEARAISTLVTVRADGTVSLAFSDKFLRGFDDDVASDFYQLWDADGGSLARSESLEDKPDLPMKAGSMKKPKYFFLELPDGKRGRGIGVRFEPRPAIKGTKAESRPLTLVVAAHSGRLDEELRELLIETGTWAAALLLAVGLLVPWLLHLGLKPLDRLADEVAAVDASTLDARFATGALPLELTPIATKLNAFMERLEASFERERRVSAAMAHELRTPIAELRTLAESALRWPDTRPPATDADALDIARQMEAIVSRMLALARSESGQLAAARQPANPAEHVRRAWQSLEGAAAARRASAAIEVEPAQVEADPALLHSILVNLIENAIEYGPEGGTIRITGTAQADGYRLLVANAAPDLTPTDTAHLFERFWRKEAARSGGVHMGLGLALVREFARAMGWEVHARLEPPQTLVIALLAPLQAASAGRPDPG